MHIFLHSAVRHNSEHLSVTTHKSRRLKGSKLVMYLKTREQSQTSSFVVLYLSIGAFIAL